MNLAYLLKKNIVMVPVVASVLVGTFTGVKYIVNLTDTINGNRAEIEKIKTVDLVNIQRDMAVLTEKTNTCLLYTSPSPRDRQKSRMPSSA